MRLGVVLDYVATEAGLPTRVEERDGYGYALWEDPANAQLVVVNSGGRRGVPTLHVTWVTSEGGANGMFAPERYDYLPWLARDVARVLRDGPDATITLGGRYVSEEHHRAQVERVHDHRRRVAHLLARTEEGA